MMTAYTQHRIVIIEDDDDYVQLVIDRLEWQGFCFIVADTGDIGMAKVRTHLPDLVILDLRLSRNLEGLTVLRELREDPLIAQIPVIIHSVRANERDLRTQGINLGAWYCLDKNDSLSELEAIVHRALAISRYGQEVVQNRRLLPLDFDSHSGTVWLDGVATEIRLSRYQALLLSLLVRRAGQIVSRDDIAREVYNQHDLSNEPIDRLVSRLRQKLGDSTVAPRYIESIHGIGYRLKLTRPRDA